MTEIKRVTVTNVTKMLRDMPKKKRDQVLCIMVGIIAAANMGIDSEINMEV